jgi:hypothetical protein
MVMLNSNLNFYKSFVAILYYSVARFVAPWRFSIEVSLALLSILFFCGIYGFNIDPFQI